MNISENAQPKSHQMWCHYDTNYGLRAFCSCGWKTQHARKKIISQKMARHYAKTGHELKGDLKTGDGSA